MKTIIPELKKHFENNINRLKEELKTIRTSHASPALIEGLEVETYGGTTTMRLMEMATLTNEGPTALLVVPFDPSTLQDIERAIIKSPLGLSPNTQSGRIIITVPALSTEQREKYVKLVGSLVEEFRSTVRGYRDDARKKIKHAIEAKEITEDDKFRLEKQVDEETQKTNEAIQTIKESKEKEIKTV
ncbi:MAG: ribosome-recycling factor [Patescibacteria group bacterium]